MAATLLIRAAGYRIKFCSPTVALVRSSEGRTYRVDLDANTCSCLYGLSSKSAAKPCKHLPFVKALAELLDWPDTHGDPNL